MMHNSKLVTPLNALVAALTQFGGGVDARKINVEEG